MVSIPQRSERGHRCHDLKLPVTCLKKKCITDACVPGVWTEYGTACTTTGYCWTLVTYWSDNGIISYPCCENGVWQAVCEEPAGMAQGCQDTGHLLVRQDIHLYLTRTPLMMNKLLKLHINQGHWSLTSQMMI